MDKLDLLAYDRWRMNQLHAIRKQLGTEGAFLPLQTLMLALEGL